MPTILGLDPALNATGWGVIRLSGNHLSALAAGVIRPKGAMHEKLNSLFKQICALVEEHQPDMAAVEETFVNCNPRAALTLGQARGVVLLAPVNCGLPVAEYPANTIKKTVTGHGHAAKAQVAHMVQLLTSSSQAYSHDATDALAAAICHAQHQQLQQRLAG